MKYNNREDIIQLTPLWKEAARLAVPVHRQLDSRKQVGGLLDFVEDDRAGEIADEPDWIAGGEGERGGEGEAEAGAVLAAGEQVVADGSLFLQFQNSFQP